MSNEEAKRLLLLEGDVFHVKDASSGEEDENNCGISINIDESENPSISLPETISGLGVEIEEQTYDEEDNLPLSVPAQARRENLKNIKNNG